MLFIIQQVMLPDVAVLSRLLDPSSPYNPATAAVAAASVSAPGHGHRPPTPLAGVVAAAAAAAEAEVSKGKVGVETKGQWKDSLRAINDIILRRHFAELTRYVGDRLAVRVRVWLADCQSA